MDDHDIDVPNGAWIRNELELLRSKTAKQSRELKITLLKNKSAPQELIQANEVSCKVLSAIESSFRHRGDAIEMRRRRGFKQSITAWRDTESSLKVAFVLTQSVESGKEDPHDCCGHHGHSHHHEEKQVKKKDLSELMKQCLLEAMVRQGQCHLELRDYIGAVDSFRNALLHDKSCFLAWVLRARTFLLMDAPLLAELHLNQKEVDQTACEVIEMRTEIERVVENRQKMELNDIVNEASERYDSRDFETIRRLKVEGDRLRFEQFHYSAIIKYLTCRKLIKIFGEESLGDLDVSCLLSLAACYIHRGTDYPLAVIYCTLALQDKKYGYENPKALLYRAQAHKGLGEYWISIEELKRAARACKCILGENVSKSDSVRGLPVVSFFTVDSIPVDDSHLIKKLAKRISDELDSVRYMNRQLGQVTAYQTRASIGCYMGTRKPFSGFPNRFNTVSSPNTADDSTSKANTRKSMYLMVLPSSIDHLELVSAMNWFGKSISFKKHFAASFDADVGFQAILQGELDSKFEPPILYQEFQRLGFKTMYSEDFILKTEDELLLMVCRPKTPTIESLVDFFKNSHATFIITCDSSLPDGSTPLTLVDDSFQKTTIFEKGERIRRYYDTESAIGIITEIDFDSRCANVDYLSGHSETAVPFPQLGFVSTVEETIITSALDLLPTMIHFATGESTAIDCIGRDLSGYLRGVHSGDHLVERGNFALCDGLKLF